MGGDGNPGVALLQEFMLEWSHVSCTGTNKESTSPFTASEADHARLSLTAKQLTLWIHINKILVATDIDTSELKASAYIIYMDNGK